MSGATTINIGPGRECTKEEALSFANVLMMYLHGVIKANESEAVRLSMEHTLADTYTAHVHVIQDIANAASVTPQQIHEARRMIRQHKGPRCTPNDR